jgi:glucose/arabinose dehydrogenase
LARRVSWFVILAAAVMPHSVSAQLINGAGIQVQGARTPDTDVEPGKPLPTNPRIAPKQSPAFREQTRAPTVITRTPIAVQIITQNLDRPWGFDFIDEGRIIVSKSRVGCASSI